MNVDQTYLLFRDNDNELKELVFLQLLLNILETLFLHVNQLLLFHIYVPSINILNSLQKIPIALLGKTIGYVKDVRKFKSSVNKLAWVWPLCKL